MSPEARLAHKRQLRRACRATNPDKVKAQAKRAYLRHRDKMLAKSKAWKKSHPGRYKTCHTQWRKSHPARWPAYQAATRARRALVAQTSESAVSQASKPALPIHP